MTACYIEPSADKTNSDEEEIYTGDLLFYDDEMDLDRYLDGSEKKSSFPLDLDKEPLKENPVKVKEVTWGVLPRSGPPQTGPSAHAKRSGRSPKK